MAGVNYICDNLIPLCMPNQGTKSKNSVLSSHFLIYSLFPFASPLHHPLFFIPRHLLFSHLPFAHCLCLPHLTFPSSPFTRLSSPSGGFAC